MKQNRIGKWLVVIIILVLGLGLLSAAEALSGSGTKDDPWIVENEGDLITAIENGGVIQLGQDISLSANLICSKDFTIDLNSHTLNTGAKMISTRCNAVFQDSSETPGKITGTANYTILVGTNSESGQLTIESGTYETNNSRMYTILVYASGNLVVNGGNIKGTIAVIGTATVNDGLITCSSYGIHVSKTGSATNEPVLTVNGGTIKTTGLSDAIILSSNCSATINGGTIQALYQDSDPAKGGVGIAAFKNTRLTVNGGSISAASFGIAGNGSVSDSNEGTNAKFIITGGTISSENTAGIYAPQVNGETIISGGKITGGRSGIEIRAGSLTITNGTITGNQDSYDVTGVVNGLPAKGSAVSVIQHTAKLPINVTISGGTFSGNIPFSERDALGNGEGSTKDISYSITGGKFISSGDETVSVQDMYQGKFITGGTFTHPVPDYVKDGYWEVSDLTDAGPWTVLPIRKVTVAVEGKGTASAEHIVEAPYPHDADNTGKNIITKGMKFALNAAPNTGWRFSGWEADPDETVIHKNKFTVGDEDVSITAVFEPVIYRVTVTDDGNGKGAASPGSGSMGTEVALIAVPNDGYQFKEWQVISGEVDVNENKFTIGTADVEVKAIFEKIPEPDPATIVHTVTVTNDGNGLAAANPSSGVTDTEVTLVAAPSDGYQFREWKVISGSVTIEKNKFKIGTANVEVQAIFEKIPEPATPDDPGSDPNPDSNPDSGSNPDSTPDTYNVKVTSDGNGLGAADPASGKTGTEVTLTYAPFTGYRFKEWQVVSGGVTVTDSKFTIGTANVEIKAVFEKEPEPEPEPEIYTVKITNDGNGLAVADPASGKSGTEVTLTYAPFEGYQFNEWQVLSGGVTVTDNKFTIGTANVEIKAVFEKKTDPEPEPAFVTVEGGRYELDAKKKNAVFTGPEDRKARTLLIQNNVTIGGKSYKVTEIAEGACKGMSKLTTLTIGKNVKTIGKEAFLKCKKAKKITFLGTALKKVGENAFGGTPKKAVVNCPKKKVKSYKKLLQKAGLPKTAKVQAAK